MWRSPSKGWSSQYLYRKRIGENMKTIAVIESCDTKYKEAKFISDFIKNEGLNALVINTATGPAPSYNYDISSRVRTAPFQNKIKRGAA